MASMRGNAVIEGIATSWDVTSGGGLLVEHTTLSTVTNAEGKAGMRFVNSDEAETSTIQVRALGRDDVKAVTFARTAYLPELRSEGSPRNPGSQEPLMVRESYGDVPPGGGGNGGLRPVWIFRAWDPVWSNNSTREEPDCSLRRTKGLTQEVS